MANKLTVFIALIAGFTVSFPVVAKLYKWVDDKGTTHYGETIPPEYADKDRVELNQAGRIIKNEAVITPERRRAKELEDAKKRDDDKLALEQKRRDRTLINTYSNVKEIDQARLRSVQQVDAKINVLNSYIKTATDNLSALQKEADAYTAANKNIPASLNEDLQEAGSRLIKLQHDAEQPNTEKAALETRFAEDKARYMELTGKK
ncbi:MAG: DUF4124 domain-containing protein [Gallionella sp.]